MNRVNLVLCANLLRTYTEKWNLQQIEDISQRTAMNCRTTNALTSHNKQNA